ncbi:MAG: hypothetical protein AAGF92_12800 [Myxococcota bacterium]
MRRTGIHLLVILSLVVGAAAAVDAAVVTDQERMEAFVEAVTGKVSSTRIDSALKYANPSKVSMDLVTEGRRHRYDDRNATKLKADARKALAPLEGSRLSLLQENIQLDGERARIALRLRTNEGFANTVFDLRREDDEWLLRRVTVN